MGGGSIRSEDMRDYYSKSTITRATDAREVFHSRNMIPEFDPSKMKLPREACDSAESPLSRGIIFAEDVTGSMGRILLSLVRDQFPRLIKQTYEKVSYNPHIMFMGVGDVAAGDDAPLQVTQFETDLRMLEQLQKIWLEEGGGGNGSESYILPWYFAAKHTRMDCYEKRGQKGFLFTFGDDGPTPQLTSNHVRSVFGKQDSLDVRLLTGKDCLEMASEKFYCYHVHFGDYYEWGIDKWRKLMGSHFCVLTDYRCMPELVTTILAMYEGLSKTEALNKIEDVRARRVVEDALKYHEETVEDKCVKESINQPEPEIF